MKQIPSISLMSLLAVLTAFGAAVNAKDSHLAEPFVGSWQVAKPAAEGVLVNVPLADCSAPAVITKGEEEGGDKHTLVYDSPKGEPSVMDLMLFNNRTTWFPEGNGPTTLIAEVKDKDKFWLYTVNMGKADWANPLEYRRCAAAD